MEEKHQEPERPMNVAAELDTFLKHHREHGRMTPNVSEPTPIGRRLEVACACGRTWRRLFGTRLEKVTGEGLHMPLADIAVTLKKLLREVAEGSTPGAKRERQLYTTLLGLVAFLEEIDAGAADIGSRLARVEDGLRERSPRGESPL